VEEVTTEPSTSGPSAGQTQKAASASPPPHPPAPEAGKANLDGTQEAMAVATETPGGASPDEPDDRKQ
jgi:hypothetical protein